ncbi:RNA polymerase sigma factor [Nocardia fusca]|uniref:RNA polymerase sigma factor n=1 Tax=Nocardia fusca TaxID=941183 RepID=UPI0037C4F649
MRLRPRKPHKPPSPEPRAGGGDRALFEQLYRREHARVRRYLLTAVRGNVECAEDLAHEVFLQVWRAYAPRLASMTDADVQRILITAAKNRLIDLWRMDSKLVFLPSYDNCHLPSAGSDRDPFDRVLDAGFVVRFAQVAVKHLTDGEFRVAFMGWMMGYTDAEIAAALGTTAKTVRTHRCSAKKKIQAFVCTDGQQITFHDSEDDQSSTPTPGIDGVRI